MSSEQHISKPKNQFCGAPGCALLCRWASCTLLFLLLHFNVASVSDVVSEHSQIPLPMLRSRWRSTLQGAQPHGDLHQSPGSLT